MEFGLKRFIISHEENGSRPQGPLCPINVSKTTEILFIVVCIHLYSPLEEL